MERDCSAKKITNSKCKVRKSLHNLQPSATDKENLVGAGRMVRTSPRQKNEKVKTKSVTPKKEKSESPKKKVTTSKSKKITNRDKAVQTARGEKIKIEVEDLTSLAGPSENYWEIIAERRRIALEETLEQNKEFAERIEKLTEENRICNEMLDEARALVEVLQDMIGDDRNDINNSLDDSVPNI